MMFSMVLFFLHFDFSHTAAAICSSESIHGRCFASLGGCLEWGLFGCLRMSSSWISLYGLYFHQADQSGTIMDILADDGKPVSIETVCLLSFIFLQAVTIVLNGQATWNNSVQFELP
jgi:hypothetical protein